MMLGVFIRAVTDPSVAMPTGPSEIAGESMAYQALETHHWHLGHARAVQTYRSLAFAGEVGITLSIHPAYPASDTDADRSSAHLIDGLHNRWFLDPILLGEYPADIVDLYSAHADLGISDGDMASDELTVQGFVIDWSQELVPPQKSDLDRLRSRASHEVSLRRSRSVVLRD